MYISSSVTKSLLIIYVTCIIYHTRIQIIRWRCTFCNEYSFQLTKKKHYIFFWPPKCMELYMHIYVLNIIFKNWNDYNHILILFVKILFDCSHVISWVLEREEIMQCIYEFINHILNLKANRNQPFRNYFQKPQRIFVHKIPSQTQIIFIKPNNPNFTKCENTFLLQQRMLTQTKPLVIEPNNPNFAKSENISLHDS